MNGEQRTVKVSTEKEGHWLAQMEGDHVADYIIRKELNGNRS